MRLCPSVVACPSKLIVGDHRLNVRLLHPADPAPPANSGRPAARGQQSFSPPAPQPAEVIDLQIDGEFTGWDGETIFRLMNGQIWQQTSYSYTYHYDFIPKVLIFRTGGGTLCRWTEFRNGLAFACFAENLAPSLGGRAILESGRRPYLSEEGKGSGE